MIRLLLLDTTPLDDPRRFAEVLARCSPARRDKVLRYAAPGDRRLRLGAGVILEYGLRDFGLRERTAPLFEDAWGKPRCAGRSDVHFSLAHSGRYAVGAFSQAEIGVDIEQFTPVAPEVAARCLSPAEYAFFLAQPDAAAAFSRLWTLKESFLKRTGGGLRLWSEAVTPLPGDAAGLRSLCGGRCFFREYPLSGYALAVCGSGDSFPAAPERLYPWGA